MKKGKYQSWKHFYGAVLFIAVFTISTLYTHLTARVGLDVVLGVSAVAVFAHAIYRHKKIGGFPKRTGVPNISAAFLWASMFFEIFSAAESALSYYGIFLLSPNRQLSIELLSVFYSVAAVWFLIKKLVSPDKALAEYQPVSENEKDVLNRFSDAYGLTLREREIISFLIQGCSNADICAAACISEGTVKAHTHNIYQKLDVKNRVQLGVKMKEFQKSGLKR